MAEDQSIQQAGDNFTLLDGLDRTGVETLIALLQTPTNQAAADALKITRQALWLRIQKYKLKEIIAEVPKQAVMRLQLGSTKAAERLIDLTDAKDDRVKLEASKEILDRVGISGGPDVVINAATQVNLPEAFDKYDQIPPQPGDGSQGPQPVPGS
jgi:HEAT repeat protein